MLTRNPTATIARNARRVESLKNLTDNDVPLACGLCGETRPFALHTREGHHVAGRANDETLTVPICLNCHAVTHETMRSIGVPLAYPNGRPEPLDRLCALLASAGAFHIDLGNRFVEWAEWLTDGSDRPCPGESHR